MALKVILKVQLLELGEVQVIGGDGEEGIKGIPRYMIQTSGIMKMTFTEVEQQV